MKKSKMIGFFLSTVLLCVSCSNSDDGNGMGSGDPDPVNRTKQDVVDILKNALSSNKVITGQHCGDGLDQNASFYNNYVEELANQSGKYVGVVGADIGFQPSDTYPVQTLINHWNEGGLVSMSWHLDNPFTDDEYSFRWNSVDNQAAIDFLALIKDAPESDAKTSYRDELDKVAKALQKLKEAGVVVIWRPFHEMNGNWFWWGINDYNNNQTNEEDFVILWKDLHETLTNDYDLDNLLWAYAATEFRAWNGEVMAYYPGDDYVDIVGIDYYTATPEFQGIEALQATGKIPVLTEVGPSEEGRGNWDENEIVNNIKGKAAYFLQWHSWLGADVAIIDNLNANTMMNSEDALTRDELNW